MFNHMLVPMDGSQLAERVLPHVVATARACDARVTVLQVCEPRRGGETVRSIDALRWHLRTAEADTYLKQVVARLRKAGLKAQPQRLEGRAAEQITAYAHQNAVDLIVLSSHGRSGLTGWNVSSVVQKVLAGTLISIMIVRAHQTPHDPLELTYSRILCPLDCSQRAEHALPAAVRLAKAYAAHLTLAHVVAKPEMARRRPLSEEEQNLIDKVTELNRQEAVGCLDEARSCLRLEQLDVQVEVTVSDNAAEALHELVGRQAIDLVILSAHGLSGSRRRPYGDMTLNFIAYGTPPLLIVQDLSPDQLEQAKPEVIARESGVR